MDINRRLLMKALLLSLISALTAVICYVIINSLTGKTVKSTRPHIIFVLADDLGWDDVSFHGSPEIPTPNLDALASSGILLNNYYVERACSPSRAALLTGKYPIRLGLQHFVIQTVEPSALPIEEKILPQYLKELGYATHIVGKWHLGSHKMKYTPTYRGFDSFFGYYKAYIDYYDYTHLDVSRLAFPKSFYGIDLRDGTRLVTDLRGKYATDLFTEKAINIIQNHDESQPLFLYLPHLAVHTANAHTFLQAPYHLVNQFGHIKNDEKRKFAGMVSGLDKSVGDVFEALYKRDMLSNSIFIFSSDNGGETNRKIDGYSSNYPLRGKKYTLWEGGIRVPSFIWSPLLRLREPRVSMQLMHITDWVPTLYSAAGGDVNLLSNMDGKSMWEAFLNNTPSPRQEILHNIDPIENSSSLRMGHFKIITGDAFSGIESWYGRQVLEDIKQPKSMDEWVYKNGSKTRDILFQMGSYLPNVPDSWRQQAEVRCKGSPEVSNECNPKKMPCLFNITKDPCETTNIADLHPGEVHFMLDALKDYEKQAVKPQFKDNDPHGDPLCHGFSYVPWMEPEHISECPFR